MTEKFTADDFTVSGDPVNGGNADLECPYPHYWYDDVTGQDLHYIRKQAQAHLDECHS